MKWIKEYFIGSPIYFSEDRKYWIKYRKSTRKYELYEHLNNDVKVFHTLSRAKKEVEN